MNDKYVEEYKNSLKEDIFACMEMGKQPYNVIMQMPIKRLRDYLKWKTKLEEEKQKMMENETNG